MGSFVIAGEGAGNAQSALDTTAAGDIWDNGFSYTKWLDQMLLEVQ